MKHPVKCPMSYDSPKVAHILVPLLWPPAVHILTLTWGAVLCNSLASIMVWFGCGKQKMYLKRLANRVPFYLLYNMVVTDLWWETEFNRGITSLCSPHMWTEQCLIGLWCTIMKVTRPKTVIYIYASESNATYGPFHCSIAKGFISSPIFFLLRDTVHLNGGDSASFLINWVNRSLLQGYQPPWMRIKVFSRLSAWRAKTAVRRQWVDCRQRKSPLDGAVDF